MNYTKRDTIKDYFPLPNEIFRLGLSSGEISVYAYLMACENRKTYQCYPSYKTIGKAIGKSKNSVKKYVDGLINKHLITTQPTSVYTQSGRKRNGNLMFTIRPIDEAVQYYYEQQMEKFDREILRKKAQKALEKYDRKHPKN